MAEGKKGKVEKRAEGASGKRQGARNLK